MRSGVAVCALLCLTTTLAMVDRQILALLVEPIKAHLGISDFQLSLLLGLAFVSLYSVAGLFFGYLADRMSRRNLLMGCLALWSLGTIGCGLARNFGQLFVARMVIGVGEAGVQPAAYSLLCDYFAPRHRGRAFGAFGLAGNLGLAFTSLGGGAFYRWLETNPATLAPLLTMAEPWQVTFMAAGVPSLACVLLYLLVKEPRRQTIAGDSAGSTATQFLSAKKWILWPLIVHFSLYMFVSFAAMSWAAAFYMRVFEVSLFEAGLITGSILIVGSSGSLIAGFLGDAWIKRGAFGGRLRMAVVSPLIALPSLSVWFLSGNKTASIAAGMLAWAACSMTATSAALTLVEIAPNQFRGRLVALYYAVASAFGAVLGPLVVGSLTDFVFRDESKINYAMAVATLTAITLSTVIALFVIKAYDAELRAVLRDEPRDA